MTVGFVEYGWDERISWGCKLLHWSVGWRSNSCRCHWQLYLWTYSCKFAFQIFWFSSLSLQSRSRYFRTDELTATQEQSAKPHSPYKVVSSSSSASLLFSCFGQNSVGEIWASTLTSLSMASRKVVWLMWLNTYSHLVVPRYFISNGV